jgi:hypothetical protein
LGRVYSIEKHDETAFYTIAARCRNATNGEELRSAVETVPILLACAGREPPDGQLRARLREHDVAGLQIAVGDTLAVRLVQRVGNLDGELQYLLYRQRTFLQPLRQRLAFQILHYEEINSVLMADVVEDADVWMIQAGDGLCFALKSLAQLGTIGKMRRQNFDGNNAIQTRIPGFINLAYSARTNSGKDFVRP